MDLFDPLLKSRSENPYATLIALYLNAVQEVHNPDDEDTSKSELQAASQYIWPSDADLQWVFSAGAVKLHDAMSKFRDFDSLFQTYIVQHQFARISWDAGLVMKDQNTIIGKWPLPLERNASQKEFDVSMSSGHTGFERHVEWARML